MKKVELKRIDKAAERDILKLIDVDESGFVIYPGNGPIETRTGSPAQQLIEWYLYRNSETKPLDANIFVDMIDNLLKEIKKH